MKYHIEQVGTRWRVVGPDTDELALYYTEQEAKRAAAVFNRAAAARAKVGIAPVAIHRAPLPAINPPTISKWKVE